MIAVTLLSLKISNKERNFFHPLWSSRYDIRSNRESIKHLALLPFLRELVKTEMTQHEMTQHKTTQIFLPNFYVNTPLLLEMTLAINAVRHQVNICRSQCLFRDLVQATSTCSDEA
jgi:hypothetical protein